MIHTLGLGKRIAIGSLQLIVGKIIIPVANVPTEHANGNGGPIHIGKVQVIVVVKIVTALHRQVRVLLFLARLL
jgi:hypothetical protein